MNNKKVILILSLFGVLTLIFLLNFFGDEEISGVIKKIEYGNNKISIFLDNSNTEFIVFSQSILEIREGEKATIKFKRDNEATGAKESQNQGIVSKIILN